MSQDAKSIANGTGAAVRAALNLAIERLATNGKGNSRPSDISAGEFWIDDNTPSSTVWTLYFYDGASDIYVCQLDTTNDNIIPLIGGGSTSIASASTTGLGSASQGSITISGTTTITSFGSASTFTPLGSLKVVRFSGSLTLTHNATSLILPGGANITTADGDCCIVQALGGSNWRVVNYTRASGVPLTTSAVVQRVETLTGAVATGTTLIPIDDTIPQNNEGDEYMTLAITPKNANNKLVIDVVVNLSNSATPNYLLIAALFQDSTANALVTVATQAVAANGLAQLTFRHVMTANTTSSTTFKVRAGSHTAGTTTFNGQGGNRRFGGVMPSSITITEYSA